MNENSPFYAPPEGHNYAIVIWPGSQEVMEKPWFGECHLVNDEEGVEKYGSCAFYVPVNRLTIGLEQKTEISDYVVKFIADEDLPLFD